MKYEIVDEDDPGSGGRISALMNNGWRFLGYARSMPSVGIYGKDLEIDFPNRLQQRDGNAY